MSKKCFMVITAVAVMLFLTVLGSAMANPVPWPSKPNLERPTITIQSPQNNTAFAYNDTGAWLNFTVNTPDSWSIQHMVKIPLGVVESVEACLDGNRVYFGSNRDSYSVELKFNQSTPGPHMLNVTTFSYTYYRGPAYNDSHIPSDIMSSSGIVYQYPLVSSDMIYFTIEQPTQTRQDEADPQVNTQPSQQAFPTWILLPIAAVAALGVVVLFYRRKKAKV